MIVGLTGGVATGKSTVAKMLVARGARLIDADQLARTVVEPGTEGLAKVRAKFGESVITTEGELDRGRLRHLIFQDESLRTAINEIIHPLVRQEMRRQIMRYREADPEEVIILDIPLLYESQLTHMVESVIVVYVPFRIQLERLILRDQMGQAAAERMLAAQWSIEKKKEMADFCIDNSKDLVDTERQVDLLWRQLTRKEDELNQ
ncbi:dephospho-CoA kinase [Mechercharimyces sp. CAU 1602]|uniref:dephospho-CoA kinase n=1 Tax=Mechercharimyces sp. CAU 1602 TaxID=2973933 RepID=UPI00216172C9|nr:dephospho-CoA kinase [Mechercharimyces sp. CAU 1602]MCS1351591.1 dephospho-CoA kinase [Mechercharimyces sp. CAU 1602]